MPHVYVGVGVSSVCAKDCSPRRSNAVTLWQVRTDVENIGLWEGKPYLVYSIQHLAAFKIEGGRIAEIPLSS